MPGNESHKASFYWIWEVMRESGWKFAILEEDNGLMGDLKALLDLEPSIIGITMNLFCWSWSKWSLNGFLRE